MGVTRIGEENGLLGLGGAPVRGSSCAEKGGSGHHSLRGTSLRGGMRGGMRGSQGGHEGEGGFDSGWTSAQGSLPW